MEVVHNNMKTRSGVVLNGFYCSIQGIGIYIYIVINWNIRASDHILYFYLDDNVCRVWANFY